MLTELGEGSVSEPQTYQLEDRLLWTGLEAGNFVYASGEPANNKLNLGADELKRSCTQLYFDSVNRLRGIVSAYSPDLLVGVPTGADDFVRDIAEGYRWDYFLLSKRYGKPQLPAGVTSLYDGSPRRIVMVEDVPNNLTTTRRVLELPGVAEQTVAIAALFDRGDPRRRNQLRKRGLFPRHIPVEAAVRRHIPPMVEDNDPVWLKARPENRPQ